MICKGYISEEVKRGHSKKTGGKLCRLCRQTSNIYEIPKQQHKKLLHDNVIKTYIKAPPKLEKSLNLEAKIITSSFTWMTATSTFIMLKYHKQDFTQNPPC